MNWFEVDKSGLAKILERRGKAFVLLELIQNALDQDTTRIDVRLDKLPGTRLAEVTVEDDDPCGFSDLAHMYTLFAESGKKSDPAKRGRFNLGEKLVLAVCREARIVTTTGGYRFDETGRHRIRERRQAGSCFTGRFPVTHAEYEECVASVLTLLLPPGTVVTFNGEPLAAREPLVTLSASLPTDVTDTEGRLRRTTRMTTLQVYEPLPGETPSLYEMGIPVVENGDRYHVDVSQKIPLNFDRDNVPPAYLRAVRVHVLNATADLLRQSDSNAPWVRDSLSDPRVSDEAVRTATSLRFGDKTVVYDPSDPEANKIAVSAGYNVVHGGHLSAGEWANVQRAQAILPAGRVTPSPKPFSSDGKPLKLMPQGEWPTAVRDVVSYVRRIGHEVLGRAIRVEVANDFGWPFAAAYGDGSLILNYGRLGAAWFEDGVCERVNELLIHEFGHEFSLDHLSSEFHDGLCRVGARLVKQALHRPSLFKAEACPKKNAPLTGAAKGDKDEHD